MSSAVGKIFEHIVNKQLCAHLDRNNIISARQHGFARGHSVTTNLLSADNVNTGTPYDVITFVIARAFDKVPHAMSIDVLSSISLHQEALLWIQSFITGRFQQVRLGDAVSKVQPVTSGVIQGTVIGSVLFTIFINPLLIALGEMAYAFADDIRYVSKATASQKIRAQQAIGTLEQRTVTYLMSLSLDKCFVLHCGTNNLCYIYTCNGMPLTVVDEPNDLGVMWSNSGCGGY